MSASLLQRISGHLAAGPLNADNPEEGNLLTGYAVRYYRWSDEDLNKSGQVILFRMKGTSGPGAHVIQRPDVSIQMLCDPQEVKAGDDRMLQILQYLRDNFTVTGENGDVFNLWPTSPYAGPFYLQNNRANFELIVRCMVTDH